MEVRLQDLALRDLEAGVRFYDKRERFVSATFPFAIYYKVVQGSVCVHAVYDCRRNPRRLQARLR